MSETPSQDWVPVFKTGIDYEAEIVCDRLNDAGIAAVVQNKKDHAFNLTMGDLARIQVLVQPDREAEARDILTSIPIDEAELTRQALAASPLDPADATLAELDEALPAGDEDEDGDPLEEEEEKDE
ncbi:MAG: DUF2007 domain-containing protein [Rhodothermales bacterium]